MANAKEVSMLGSSRTYGVVSAADMDRAKKFYNEKLGMLPEMEMPGMALYHCGGDTWFQLYQSESAGTNKSTAMGWGVEDVEEEVAELKAKGVVFEDYDMPGLKTKDSIATMGPGAKAAWFKDSEGNVLCISQMPS